MLAVAAGGAAQAQVSDARFCATLRQLLAAAAERPAFVSLRRAGPTRAAAGLGYEECRIEPALYRRLVCSRPSHPRHPAGAPTGERIARCVPEALAMSEPKGSPLTRFRLGILAFHVERRPPVTLFSLFALPVER